MPSRTTDERALNKSQKLIRLLEALQEPGGATAEELMARFDLDDRTLRRYFADIKELGLPVRAAGRGLERRLWMDASYRRRGVQITLLELVSLRFGRTLFNFLQGTGFAEDLDQTLDRLSTLLVDGADRVRHLDRKFLAVPEHHKDHSQDAELLEDVLTAILYQNPATAHYARVGGPMRRYRLHPYTLATYRQGLYLIARDLDDERVKTYAIDRFRHFGRMRQEHFEYPADYEPAELFRDSFGMTATADPQTVVLRFHRRASLYVRERTWHHSQQVDGLEEGAVRLTLRVGLSPELVSWVLGFGPDVRVESPPELVERIRRLHREAAEEA